MPQLYLRPWYLHGGNVGGVNLLRSEADDPEHGVGGALLPGGRGRGHVGGGGSDPRQGGRGALTPAGDGRARVGGIPEHAEERLMLLVYDSVSSDTQVEDFMEVSDRVT